MFVHAAIVTVFAWETEGKAFDTEDVYKAFQSQAHFDAIFRSNWYTSRMKTYKIDLTAGHLLIKNYSVSRF